MWWNNRKKKLKIERLSQFRANDTIRYELGMDVVTRKVVNNDPDTRTISIMGYNGDIGIFDYNDPRFDNIRAVNPDPTDYTDLKGFLDDIIANVNNQITDLQKTRAEDLKKSFNL